MMPALVPPQALVSQLNPDRDSSERSARATSCDASGLQPAGTGLRLPVTKMNGRNVDAEAITVNYASTRKLRLLAFRSGIAWGFDSSESGCGKDAASRSETAPNRRCDNIRIARGIDARSAGAVVELCPLSPQTVTPARQFSAPATDAARSAAPRFEPPPAWRAPWARPHLRHGRGG